MAFTQALSSIPIEQRYFEDYVEGSVVDCGTIRVEQDEVLAFGQRFDPQPFHSDLEAAANSSFGGLIASGGYTISLMYRLSHQIVNQPDRA